MREGLDLRKDKWGAAKHAWNASGRSVINTRWKTSLHGNPCDSGSTDARSSSLSAAHCAIAVGPDAPASTAITTTEPRGCLRLVSDGRSSTSWKYATTSNSRVSAIDHPHARPQEAAQDMV